MHVPMEMLASQAGLKLLHVPYTGAAPAVLALLSGQVTAMSTGPASVAQHVKAGKLRVLAHWGTDPLAAFPGVPSLKETGHPVEFAQWSGLFVPADTPDAVEAKLREAAHFAANDAKVRQTNAATGTADVHGHARFPGLHRAGLEEAEGSRVEDRQSGISRPGVYGTIHALLGMRRLAQQSLFFHARDGAFPAGNGAAFRPRSWALQGKMKEYSAAKLKENQEKLRKYALKKTTDSAASGAAIAIGETVRYMYIYAKKNILNVEIIFMALVLRDIFIANQLAAPWDREVDGPIEVYLSEGLI